MQFGKLKHSFQDNLSPVLLWDMLQMGTERAKILTVVDLLNKDTHANNCYFQDEQKWLCIFHFFYNLLLSQPYCIQTLISLQ